MRTSSPNSGTVAPSHRSSHFFGDLVRFTLIALLIVIPVRLFIAQPFIVNGASMAPTFKNGEYLIVDQLSYQFDNPQRGDVVVFRYPRDPSSFYIKRVIGLPGETIELQNDTVVIYNKKYPNGTKLTEPYIQANGNVNMRRTLGANEYFVLGDNRRHSSDSRRWGALNRKHIEGRPVLRLYPVNEIDVVPGTFSYSA